MRVLPLKQGLLPLAPFRREEGGGGGGCAAFFLKSCCGRRKDGGGRRKNGGAASPVKVEAVHPSVGAGSNLAANGENNNNNNEGVFVVKTCLKSSIRKHGFSAGKRTVQWSDAHGQELVQVREFEMSDSSGSDDEDDGGVNHGCGCIIQ